MGQRFHSGYFQYRCYGGRLQLHKYRDVLERGITGDGLASGVLPAVVEVLPASGGQVYLALALTGLQNGSNQITGAEHILVGYLPALCIGGKLIEHGSHQRGTVLTRLSHKSFNVRLEGLPQIELALHDLESIIAVAPELVRLTGVEAAAAEILVGERRDIVGA